MIWTPGRPNENLSERARHRLAGVFSANDPTGSPQAAWQVKEQLRTLLNTSSLKDEDAAKNALAHLGERAAMPETKRLHRTVCRWWNEIEVLIVTGATTAKVEANNTAIKHSIPARIASSARKLMLQLPADWPWETVGSYLFNRTFPRLLETWPGAPHRKN